LTDYKPPTEPDEHAVALIEIVAIMIHGTISPTTWSHLTLQQRNSTRRQADFLINEAMLFWEREYRKAQAPL
jgi:hypothetical protein